MLIAQAIFPIKVSKTHGIIKSLFLESLFYIFVVLSLNYIEAGIEGLIHGKNFVDAMASFGQKNPLHVLAMTIVYWLIVWPYLVLVGLRLALGKDTTMNILFGKKDSAV
jgi:Na+/phosphate symporter